MAQVEKTADAPEIDRSETLSVSMGNNRRVELTTGGRYDLSVAHE